MYSATKTPQSFNYLILNNVIKVISNFTNTAITGGGSISGGGTCTAVCYLTYTSMASPVTLLANAVSYFVNIQGLTTFVVFNPLFTLSQQAGLVMTGHITITHSS